MNSSTLIPLANHLWQSTLFVILTGCLALLVRRNYARVRYSLWLAASVKFLVPFALLTAVGARIPLPSSRWHEVGSSFLSTAAQIAAPTTLFHTGSTPVASRVTQAVSCSNAVLIALGVLWALGALAVVTRRLRQWTIVRRVLRESTATRLAFVVPVRSSSSQLEPAVVGILRPVLLLPAGIERHLTAAEMCAVLAHERCHVEWQDNLAASLHMIVEALFWFHPLVWWLGSRIVDERERACDEQVLAQGHRPESYAEGILRVCERYLQSPLTSVAGIGGANLSRRIGAIMKNELVDRLSIARKLILSLAASASIAVPLAIGVVTSPRGSAEAATSEADAPALRNVAIRLASAQLPRPAPDGEFNVIGLLQQDGNRVQMFYASMRSLIARAYGVDESQVFGVDLSKVPLFQIAADNPWPEKPTATGEERAALFRRSVKELPGLQRELLATRFGLIAKHERRQLAGYVVTIGSGGSKLVPDSDAPDWKQGHAVDGGEIIATRVPVGPIVGLLQHLLRAPVVDLTGLQGTYDYKLNLAASAPGMPPDPRAMAKALEEQLGLHLEAKRVTVDVINVIRLKSPEEAVTGT